MISGGLPFFARPSNLADVCICAPAYNAKIADCSPSSDFTAFYKLSKWKDGLYLCSNYQVNFDTALPDFISRQFKTRMKKMAAQVDFYLFLNAFLSCLQFGA